MGTCARLSGVTGTPAHSRRAETQEASPAVSRGGGMQSVGKLGKGVSPGVYETKIPSCYCKLQNDSLLEFST